MSEHWQRKIERNRKGDRANIGRLRTTGWNVIRLWEHEVLRDPGACVDRIAVAVAAARQTSTVR